MPLLLPGIRQRKTSLVLDSTSSEGARHHPLCISPYTGGLHSAAPNQSRLICHPLPPLHLCPPVFCCRLTCLCSQECKDQRMTISLPPSPSKTRRFYHFSGLNIWRQSTLLYTFKSVYHIAVIKKILQHNSMHTAVV